MTGKGKILIIDDNEDILFALNALLSKHVEKVKVSTKPENIMSFMHAFNPDIIILDMNFDKDVSSGKEGFEWLEKILKFDPKAIVILMTAYADTAKAVQAIKLGATDFIAKPWENEKLLATIHSALKIKESQDEVTNLEARLKVITGEQPVEIIGRSRKMLDIFSMVEKMADTEANVLILGENGTGKDLIARTIHHNSPRADKIFVPIDLGSISESLFESELFGHEKGAFTDAKKEKQGRIEVASGGTLFLDEIANLSPAMQAKLLTTIEKRYIIRLGSVRSVPIDVRFIAATNADIYTSVHNGEFRQDLLYRINTIEIYLPPLRERGDDVILLAEHFLIKYNQKYKKDIKTISNEAKKFLISYSWPGNVRELQNVIERAVILSSGRTLQMNDLNIISSHKPMKLKGNETLNLELLEQQAIDKALDISEGNMNKAAELLGISRFALYRKLNKK
ncbi:sigma-54 dependent transcriptional regulator [Prevotella sp. 10(H)]|uniref:sigma-54-dependent transcriptional regulator n=1 Tax=Prevotella sp. 10(H) TaxID=1158294 RepID=UPI0004A6C285|nr:sigma-54 dependent transcriptional regulator [Prevotella sp. 10(H)]